jgi:hypothetical protein
MTALALMLLGLGCAAGLLQKEMHFSRAQLQKKVDTVFPVDENKALLRVRFSNPVVALPAAGERMGLALDMRVKLPGGKKAEGRLFFNSGLIYDPNRGEIALADPRLDSLDVEGVPRRFESALQTTAEVVAKRYLAQIPVYRLNADDYKQSLAKLVLKSVSIRDGEVVAVIGL